MSRTEQYTLYDPLNGKIKSVFFGSPLDRDANVGNLAFIDGPSDLETQKVVVGKLVDKTDAEIIQEKQEQDAIRLQERKQDVLQTKSLYLAAKSESPALMNYLKLTGVIPSDMDDLIK